MLATEGSAHAEPRLGSGVGVPSFVSEPPWYSRKPLYTLQLPPVLVRLPPPFINTVCPCIKFNRDST